MRTGETKKWVYVTIFEGNIHAVACIDIETARQWFKDKLKLEGASVRVWCISGAECYTKQSAEGLDTYTVS